VTKSRCESLATRRNPEVRSNMVDSEFAGWFSSLTPYRVTPHAWQAHLAADRSARSRVLRIPTGMGKTLGVFAAWAWHRVHRHDEAWPRRLVWCLPMRALVEQTQAVVAEALSRLGLLWDGRGEHAGRVGVHLLMGGSDPGGDWHLFPEECAVLVGTQDMLLSRALNRGYGAGRARWPTDFGLLSHDALWVVDEAQLMDVGLATSAQLQAYHDHNAGRGFRPRHTWWMSATLQPSWLRSVDTDARQRVWVQEPVVIPAQSRAAELGPARKTLRLAAIPASAHAQVAELALAEHARVLAGEHGRITLLVCNQVGRATETYRALRERASPSQAIELVHSRFRPAERAGWRERFLSREACGPAADRIVVATQVVEAGVDISAGCVISDLAPWSSLVQRFGRCARYGGDGLCVIVDRGSEAGEAAPYEPAELDASRWATAEVERRGLSVGLAELEAFEENLDEAERERLYPYSPSHLLLRGEFDELFDTTPDLTGGDLDVSRFIRSSDDRDLQVFWRDLPPSGKHSVGPSETCRPRRRELCAVPFLAARDWLCGREKATSRQPRLRKGVRAWVWDWVDGRWTLADRAALLPGRVVCVAADAGGYDLALGFVPGLRAPGQPVPFGPDETHGDLDALSEDANDVDGASVAGWKTIACHAAETAALLRRVTSAVGLAGPTADLLDLAAIWHDVGKAHPVFQGAIRHRERPGRHDLAKAPNEAWLRPLGSYRSSDDADARPGFRHELASALALFAVMARHRPDHRALLGDWLDVLPLLGGAPPVHEDGSAPTADESRLLQCSSDDFDLVAYLVASHHGKVRVALHAGPKDQDYPDRGDGLGLPIRGVREGDELPAVRVSTGGATVPALRLTLEPAFMGLSSVTGRSWRERTLRTQERLGPGALAWLEALLAAADRRASRLSTNDPDLGGEAAR
jgi:CRISPR-associated endonuclease/helicase Cas3